MTLPHTGDNSLFSTFEIIFIIFFALIFIGFITIFILAFRSFIISAKEKKKNDSAPVLTTEAKVVAKRAEVSVYRHRHQNTMSYTDTDTTYFVTFQVPSGDRMELETQGYEYGLLLENDTGKLTFQGNRFIKFERNKS